MRKILWLLMVGSLALASSGADCGGSPLPVSTGVLYVLDNFNKSVYVFSDINNLNGALDPQRTITGGNTLLEEPASLAVDSRRDILYVADADADAVLAFIPGSTADGDMTPRRTYPGINEPGGMYYDLIDDVLFVIDLASAQVMAWDGISQLDDGAQPTRIITLDYDPSTVFVDTQRDQLYLGAPDFNVVNVYVNASTLDTINPPPVDRTIFEATPSPSPSPFAQGFDAVNSVTMNIQNNILFVAESENPSVEIFDNASTIDSTDNGPAIPDRALAGNATGFTLDMGQIIFLENVLYAVLSRTNVGIWDSANTVDGDTAPNRNILVNGATEIVGIAVDLNH